MALPANKRNYSSAEAFALKRSIEEIGRPRKRYYFALTYGVLKIAIQPFSQLFLKVMRMQVNLAKRPFANRKLFWIVIWAFFFVSLSLGLWSFTEKTTASAEAKRLSSALSDRDRQVQQMREEAEKRSKQTPNIQLTEQDAYELAAARRLIVRKAFPWTKLVNDIDERVPKFVRVLAIKVDESVNESGAVVGLVEVKAIGKTADQMTEMMTAFDNSGGLFLRGQSSQDQALDTTEVPFTINLIYRPFGGGAQ